MSFLSKLSEMKETTKNKMEELKAWDEKISWTCFVIHVMGLPLMQNIECEVFFDEDKLTITASEQTFNLSYSKIYSIDILNEKNLRLKESQFVSSVGGAIGGAALFGTVGAIIGGRIKEKRVKADYMVITYKKNDAVDYIVLENAIKFDTSSLAMKKRIEKAKNSGLFIKHDTVEL
ncbi:MAG: hypothetical protein IJ062_01945 [Firmicutes bacterium]|nr:hypothetical protein [Bacillota bacterium]